MDVYLILIALFSSAIFSGLEIAYLSADRLRVELEKSKGSFIGRNLSRFYDDPDSFITTMLVGNNIALVIFSSFFGRKAEPLIVGLFETWNWGEPSAIVLLLMKTLVATLIVLIFAEFIPKIVFRISAFRMLGFFTAPALFFQYLFKPISYIMFKASRLLLSIFNVKQIAESHVFTKLDLENFVKKTTTKSDDEINTDFFENALYLQEVKVRSCMIPRTEIVGIDVNETVEELVSKFAESRLSRIIIFDDSEENIIGYVHHSQLRKKPERIKDIIMDIEMINETMRVNNLMNHFIKNRNSIAYVVDEFGGVSGIITMEDILEEIFGEIEDEYDAEEYVEQVISESEYRFSGRLEIGYLNEKYEAINFPEGEYSTLSGYIVTTTESIPKQGDDIVLNPYEFHLEMVSETKIESIIVKVLYREDED